MRGRCWTALWTTSNFRTFPLASTPRRPKPSPAPTPASSRSSACSRRTSSNTGRTCPTGCWRRRPNARSATSATLPLTPSPPPPTPRLPVAVGVPTAPRAAVTGFRRASRFLPPAPTTSRGTQATAARRPRAGRQPREAEKVACPRSTARSATAASPASKHCRSASVSPTSATRRAATAVAPPRPGRRSARCTTKWPRRPRLKTCRTRRCCKPACRRAHGSPPPPRARARCAGSRLCAPLSTTWRARAVAGRCYRRRWTRSLTKCMTPRGRRAPPCTVSSATPSPSRGTPRPASAPRRRRPSPSSPACAASRRARRCCTRGGRCWGWAAPRRCARRAWRSAAPACRRRSS
mmetsp:Transcript_54284/g.167043  ORF Transcript_54284/g.167043 Transcript_54284/m.167043 type:complete len:350 (-) Transcript_54284:288-1337(-)